MSAYLDCYEVLGFYGSPYWEIYPYDNGIYRCNINETDELVDVIIESINNQILNNKKETQI